MSFIAYKSRLSTLTFDRHASKRVRAGPQQQQDWRLLWRIPLSVGWPEINSLFASAALPNRRLRVPSRQLIYLETPFWHKRRIDHNLFSRHELGGIELLRNGVIRRKIEAEQLGSELRRHLGPFREPTFNRASCLEPCFHRHEMKRFLDVPCEYQCCYRDPEHDPEPLPPRSHTPKESRQKRGRNKAERDHGEGHRALQGCLQFQAHRKAEQHGQSEAKRSLFRRALDMA